MKEIITLFFALTLIISSLFVDRLFAQICPTEKIKSGSNSSSKEDVKKSKGKRWRGRGKRKGKKKGKKIEELIKIDRHVICKRNDLLYFKNFFEKKVFFLSKS